MKRKIEDVLEENKEENNENKENKENNCSICFDEVQNKANIDGCSHEFCFSCIET
jgi:hypothetical protein